MKLLDLDGIREARELLYAGRSDQKDEIHQACFRLPAWFRLNLDPFSVDYRRQQLRLWSEITGLASYDAKTNEDTPEIGSSDGLYRPGYYQPGIAAHAGDHLIALGHILRRSDVTSVSRVLEYGAGLGRIALAFARLGAKVETVDINPAFCKVVQTLAERYEVDLTSTVGQFGDSQSQVPGSYDLIYFYESFHHCLEFPSLIARLRHLLRDDGKIILAGEPIVPDDSPYVPYPWGLRLDGECVVVTNQRGWMELGFRESFLLKQFVNEGFIWARHDCPPSRFATLYVFEKRPQTIEMKHASLTAVESATWHNADPFGRFTKEKSVLFVDRSAKFIEFNLTNFHPEPMRVTIAGRDFAVQARARQTVAINPQGATEVLLETPVLRPETYGIADSRRLGIHIGQVRYVDENTTE